MKKRPDLHRRAALLKNGFTANALDAILVTDEANVAYLSGFNGHDSMALITLDKNYFITDSRYIEEAEDTLDDFCVCLVERSTYDTFSEIIGKLRLKRIGFEAMDLPYGVAARLYKLMEPTRARPLRGQARGSFRAEYPSGHNHPRPEGRGRNFRENFIRPRGIKSAKLIPCTDMVEDIRAVKDPGEIALIRSSVRLNKRVFDSALRRLEPGISERSLADDITAIFIREGARAAFEPIVASGENASKPHAVPAAVKIRDNSFVMIDIGAKLDGYCSDLTRMVTLGRVKDKFKKIYNIVRIAQEKAIETIRPGVSIRDVDAAGRDHITGSGFGKYFGHSLGHGVGMNVHEKPTVSSLSEGILKPGMVFTVEPAIYIPKFGGVRIEDMVLVTDKGCEILTSRGKQRQYGGEECT